MSRLRTPTTRSEYNAETRRCKIYSDVNSELLIDLRTTMGQYHKFEAAIRTIERVCYRKAMLDAQNSITQLAMDLGQRYR